MISSCLKRMSDSFYFFITTSRHLQCCGQTLFLTFEMSNFNMSGLKLTAAPLNANFRSRSGTLWIVLVHDCSPGAMEQNQKYFHPSWEQIMHTMLNTGVNSERTRPKEAHRDGYMPTNICPASSVQ